MNADSPPPPLINQGDVYWVQVNERDAEEAGIPHPYVVIQENVLNHGPIPTVIACALTTNLKRASWPGNVLLDVGEANLPKQSVVEVSKTATVPKTQLGDWIGRLGAQRVEQIVAGQRFLQRSFFRTSAGRNATSGGHF